MMAAYAAPSILDIKHSIDDNNIIPLESFETKTLELEQEFFLKNYSAEGAGNGSVRLGTPEEYQEKLSRLNTVVDMPYNSVVRKWIDMYLGKRPKLVSDLLALHQYYSPIFLEELEKEGVPVELQYLPVIESAINPNAVSRAGAAGLWQFMPGTAKGMGMEVSSLVDERRDPRKGSKYAAKFLRQLYERYGDWSLAIAAYNCGPGNVNKAIRRAGGGKKDFWEIYNYLPSETRGYVPAFIAANYVMNYYKDHGISPRVLTKPLITDTVQVNKRVHFDQISEVLNIPVEEIKMLNPQYRQNIIPGNNHPYSLTLPTQQIYSYVVSEDEILNYNKNKYAQRTVAEPGTSKGKKGTSPEEADDNQQQEGDDNVTAAANNNAAGNDNLPASQQVVNGNASRITHVVQHGESLRDIARKYNVSATDIKRWNNMRRAKVKEGQELVIETYDGDSYQPRAARNEVAQNQGNRGNASTNDVPLPPAKKVQPTQPSVPQSRKTATSRNNTRQDVPAPKRNSTTSATNNTSTKSSATTTSTPKSRTTTSASNNTTTSKAKAASTTKNETRSSKSNTKTTTSPKKETKKETASNNKKSKSRDSKPTASKNDKNSKKSKKAKQTAKQQPKQPATRNYEVKKGESYEAIAKRTGVSVADLKKANNAKSDRLDIGQTIKVPNKASSKTTANNKKQTSNSKQTKQTSDSKSSKAKSSASSKKSASASSSKSKSTKKKR